MRLVRLWIAALYCRGTGGTYLDTNIAAELSYFHSFKHSIFQSSGYNRVSTNQKLQIISFLNEGLEIGSLF